jgi:hypothetical protein
VSTRRRRRLVRAIATASVATVIAGGVAIATPAGSALGMSDQGALSALSWSRPWSSSGAEAREDHAKGRSSRHAGNSDRRTGAATKKDGASTATRKATGGTPTATGKATGGSTPTSSSTSSSTSSKAAGTTAATKSSTSTATRSSASSSSSPTSSTGTSSTGTSSTATTGTQPKATTGGPFIAYSADSYFRKPLPAITPISSSNAAKIAFAKSSNPDSYLKLRGPNGIGWGIAYGEGSCSDPIYKIGSSGNLPASQAHLRTVGFHAPAAMWQHIPPNGDAPFLVIDRCGTSARPGGLSVWGANAVVSGNTVTISAAGSFAHDSNGLDRRNPQANSQLNERSRGVIPDSMAIRIDLLDNAIRTGSGLGHVLEVFWSETDSAAGFASPMIGAENGKVGVGAEGERFRIKPGINLASRPGCSPSTNPVGLAIARTLQQNGAYLGDNSGSGSGIKTEQNANYPGLTADSLQGCMTWDDIEFLPRGWTG